MLNALVFVAAFYAMRPLIVLVYAFVEHDVEAWACGVGKREGYGDAERLCAELRAARYLLVPMLVLGMAFLSLVIWQRWGDWRIEGKRESGTGRASRGDAVTRKL